MTTLETSPTQAAVVPRYYTDGRVRTRVEHLGRARPLPATTPGRGSARSRLAVFTPEGIDLETSDPAALRQLH